MKSSNVKACLETPKGIIDSEYIPEYYPSEEYSRFVREKIKKKQISYENNCIKYRANEAS